MPDPAAEEEADVKAISALIAALKPLDPDSRVYVLEFVLKKLGIPLGSNPSAPTPTQPPISPPAEPLPPAASPRPAVHDIRTLANEKKPRTVNEKIALIGYFLEHLAPEGERRDYLVADDVQNYFKQAGFELPTAPPSVTLSNAKNAGYLNVAERGHYKLNAVGYNLVSHKLPGDQAREPKRRRPKTTKSAKRKVKVKARRKAAK